MRAYSKQHESVYETIEKTGRYVAKRAFVEKELDRHAYLMVKVYDMLGRFSPNLAFRPKDAEIPVWFVTKESDVMLNQPGFVILTMEIPNEVVAMINIAKWGAIMNYSYLPKDARDGEAHVEKMKRYGTSDSQAVMSQFYPHLKREIEASWSRLFDDQVQLGNDQAYGTVWELKKEWILKVQR